MASEFGVKQVSYSISLKFPAFGVDVTKEISGSEGTWRFSGGPLGFEFRFIGDVTRNYRHCSFLRTTFPFLT